MGVSGQKSLREAIRDKEGFWLNCPSGFLPQTGQGDQTSHERW
jgi:hypothetical protein